MTKHKSIHIYWIFAIFLISVIPVILYRDFTPSNELRYLSIADESIASSTLFAFTNHGMPYADKPPMYLWLVMLCRVMAGQHAMWLLSLLSIIPAIAGTAIMWRLTRNSLPEKYALAGVIMLQTSGIYLISSLTLRMDMLMCMFIILAFYSFWRMFSQTGHSRLHFWLFPLFLFLAIFTKGPYGILIPLTGTTVFLIFARRIGDFFRYWGWRTWGILLLLCALWFMCVYLEGGREYLDNLLFHQTIDRAVNSFHHDQPFYYYAICIWYCLAPWSLLVIGVMTSTFRSLWRNGDMQTYLVVSSLSAFVVLSFISSKLSIYILPIMPLMVYAAILRLPEIKDNIWLRMSLGVTALVFALGYPALEIAVRYFNIPSFLSGIPFKIGAAALSIGGISALIFLFRRIDRTDSNRKSWFFPATVSMAAGMMALLFAGGFGISSANPYIGYGSICRKASELSQTEGIPTIHTWNVRRAENIDVYLHRPVLTLEGEDPPLENVTYDRLLIIRKKNLDKFPGYRSYTVGDYSVVVCKAAKDKNAL